MMQRDSIMDRVAECIKKVTLGKVDTVNCNDRIEEDLGIDSMGATEMVFSLEDEFDTSISDSELFEIKTVEDIIELLLKKDKNVVN